MGELDDIKQSLGTLISSGLSDKFVLTGLESLRTILGSKDWRGHNVERAARLQKRIDREILRLSHDLQRTA